MKRSPLKRSTFKRSSRKPLRKVSKKRAAKNAQASVVRRELCEVSGVCDMCEQAGELCAHEIARGSRVKAYDQPCAMLILCWGCHKHVHETEGTIWGKAMQAALLRIRRPQCFDLTALNRLLIRKLDEEEIGLATKRILDPEDYERRIKQGMRG